MPFLKVWCKSQLGPLLNCIDLTWNDSVWFYATRFIVRGTVLWHLSFSITFFLYWSLKKKIGNCTNCHNWRREFTEGEVLNDQPYYTAQAKSWKQSGVSDRQLFWTRQTNINQHTTHPSQAGETETWPLDAVSSGVMGLPPPPHPGWLLNCRVKPSTTIAIETHSYTLYSSFTMWILYCKLHNTVIVNIWRHVYGSG